MSVKLIKLLMSLLHKIKLFGKSIYDCFEKASRKNRKLSNLIASTNLAIGLLIFCNNMQISQNHKILIFEWVFALSQSQRFQDSLTTTYLIHFLDYFEDAQDNWSSIY